MKTTAKTKTIATAKFKNGRTATWPGGKVKMMGTWKDIPVTALAKFSGKTVYSLVNTPKGLAIMPTACLELA